MLVFQEILRTYQLTNWLVSVGKFTLEKLVLIRFQYTCRYVK